MVYLIAFICVVGMAVGQILFKLTAISAKEMETYFALKPMLYFCSSIGLYMLTTLAWIWILKNAPLGRIYPLTAFAFVLVPLASYFCFGERFQTGYYFGVALIITGIIFVIRSGAIESA